MYTFLVLGLVPGTNFQITFMMWLQSIEALALALGLYIIGRRLVTAGREGMLENAALVATKLRHR